MPHVIALPEQLVGAMNLASTAAQVAHQAQPYNQNTIIYQSLQKLTVAFTDASLRCLEESMIGDPASKEPDPAELPKPEAPTEGTEPTGTLLTPTDNAPAE